MNYEEFHRFFIRKEARVNLKTFEFDAIIQKVPMLISKIFIESPIKKERNQ